MGISVWGAWWQLLSEPWGWFLLFFGLILGSFFSVCVQRIPEGTFWREARSCCPRCGALIPSWRNIPLLSFILLRGKAVCCGERISWFYPLLEVFTAGLLLALYLRYPFWGEPGRSLLGEGLTGINQPEFWRFLHAVIFCGFLLICSLIDAKHRIIPDALSLPMIALSPLVVWLHPELDWHSSIWGVLLGGGSVYAIAWVYYLIRREEGIGMGDAKLLAAIGGWLGYQAIFPTFFYGSILGSIYGLGAMIGTRRLSLKSQLPFGPFLAIGAVLYLFLSMRWQELLIYR